MKQRRRSRAVRVAEGEVPWWEPVGMWPCWFGGAFLAAAAVLSHWG